MVFNELDERGLRPAFRECRCVLVDGDLFLVAVAHLAFITDLARRGQLARRRNSWTMPGVRGLRLPVCERSVDDYHRLLKAVAFAFDSEDVFPNERVIRAKVGLCQARGLPLAWVAACRKITCGVAPVDHPLSRGRCLVGQASQGPRFGPS